MHRDAREEILGVVGRLAHEAARAHLRIDFAVLHISEHAVRARTPISGLPHREGHRGTSRQNNCSALHVREWGSSVAEEMESTTDVVGRLGCIQGQVPEKPRAQLYKV